jgi:hypothetical protein
LARFCHDSNLNQTRARLTLSRRHDSSPPRVYPYRVQGSKPAREEFRSSGFKVQGFGLPRLSRKPAIRRAPRTRRFCDYEAQARVFILRYRRIKLLVELS